MLYLSLSIQVETVLESIIGRTVEQSMIEVQHEEELLRARSVATSEPMGEYSSKKSL